MPKLYMLVGLSGSGKSSWCAQQHTMKVFSSDKMREELFNNVNEQRYNDILFKKLHERVKESLRNGYDSVVDATNLSSRRRIAFLNEIKHIPCEKICRFFPMPYEFCLERDSMRKRTVGKKVIMKQMKQFEMPHPNEGWDKIEIVYNYRVEANDLNLFLKNPMEHDCSPHHEEPIALHLILSSCIAELSGARPEMVEALKWHDVGKFLTKQFKDARGNESDIAHFYGHENVSAYLYASSKQFFKADEDFAHEVLYLIQNHMKLYNNNETFLRRFKEKYGESFIRDLEEMKYFDEEGRIKL